MLSKRIRLLFQRENTEGQVYNSLNEKVQRSYLIPYTQRLNRRLYVTSGHYVCTAFAEYMLDYARVCKLRSSPQRWLPVLLGAGEGADGQQPHMAQWPTGL